MTSENSKLIYKADFKTPVIIGWSVWLFLMVSSVIYFLVAGVDIAEEWQKSKDLIILLTLGIALMTVILPVLGWQKIELDTEQNNISITNLLDRILFRIRKVHIQDVQNIETKRKPRRGEILYLELKDGTIHKVNITNLKNGKELEKYLQGIVKNR